jgi:hypothetical protein
LKQVSNCPLDHESPWARDLVCPVTCCVLGASSVSRGYSGMNGQMTRWEKPTPTLVPSKSKQNGVMPILTYTYVALTVCLAWRHLATLGDRHCYDAILQAREVRHRGVK